MSEEIVHAPEPRVLEPVRPAALAAPQAAAVAAGGFVAGAATMVMAHRRAARRAARRGALPVLASRSFLVDIHLLDRR